MLGCALAATLLAAQGWRDWREVGIGPLAPPTRGVDATQAEVISVDELIALDLMGATRAPERAAGARQDLPETRLDLGLRGVFASDRKALAGAVIVADGEQSGFYRIGDAIAPNVVLHAVVADSVVIRRGGALETLNFSWHRPEVVGVAEAAPAAGDDTAGTVATEPAATIGQSLRDIGRAASPEKPGGD